ncbi:MAG: stage V sporulation protein AD [Oscillospiraceae bacterium]|nr:stage V sporulation protein AD [Oscillospiraceae bacterium]
MAKKIARNTFIMENPPTIHSFAGIAGKTEGEGPINYCFDEICEDSYFGQETWEKAESELIKRTINKAIEKGGLKADDVDYMFAGDLLNQCIGTTYGIRELNIPVFGIYGACSTMSEGLALGALMTDSGLGGNVIAATSSHYAAAERQFRFPLSYGGIRTPTSQWTATAAGAAVITPKYTAPYIRGVTVGKIVDMGVTDAANMGAAMAPAAAYVIKTFLTDTAMTPADFDSIVTGDLGTIGSSLLIDILKGENIDISMKHKDCGVMLYDPQKQDTHAGGSGCGCSASVLCGYFLNKLKTGELKNILFCATGALMSPTSAQQGESIPGISHAVFISNTDRFSDS